MNTSKGNEISDIKTVIVYKGLTTLCFGLPLELYVVLFCTLI